MPGDLAAILRDASGGLAREEAAGGRVAVEQHAEIQGELIAFGSGFLQLATANLIVVDRGTLALVSPAVLGVMIVAYCFYSKRLAFLPFLAPAFALFFASRELQNYYMYWPIPLMVFALSPKAAEVAEAEEAPEHRQQWSAAPLSSKNS